MDEPKSNAPKPRKPFKWAKALAVLGGFAPLAWFLYQLYSKRIVFERVVEDVVRYFGYYSLVFLLASLACTPLRVLFGWAWPAQMRKSLGLFGFFYAALHLYLDVFFQQGFDLKILFVRDMDLDRNLYWTIFVDEFKLFQIFGMTAFALLIPLALTSTGWAARKMGAKWWLRLHMLVYPIAILGVVHFYMAVKSKTDKTEPLIFGGVLAVLLGVRLVKTLMAKRAA